MDFPEMFGWPNAREKSSSTPRKVAVNPQKEVQMRSDKVVARKHGITKAHRQYSKRYGSGVEQMIADQKKHQQRRWAVGDKRGKVK